MTWKNTFCSIGVMTNAVFACVFLAGIVPAADCEFDLRSRQYVAGQVNHEWRLIAKTEVTRPDENHLVFSVTDCWLHSEQEFKDPSIIKANNLATNITLSGNNGVLTNMFARQIKYVRQNDQWQLARDQSPNNMAVANLSPFCDLILRNGALPQKTKQLGHYVVQPGQEEVLSNAASYQLTRQWLGTNNLGGNNYVISIVDTNSDMRIETRVVLTNAIFRGGTHILGSDCVIRQNPAFLDLSQKNLIDLGAFR